VPRGDRAARLRRLRARRDDRVRGAPVRGLSVRVAQGSVGVEVRRERRVKELNARQLLRGGTLEGPTRSAHLEGADLERHVEERVLTTTPERPPAWARSNSL